MDSGQNNLGDEQGSKAWELPIVGFSKGDDPIFEEIKEHIGPFYWTPLEIFEKGFPAVRAIASELTVVSWILPQAKQTRLDNRKEKSFPAERWARSKHFGEQGNARLRNHLVTLFGSMGIEAVAPASSPFWTIRVSRGFGFSSTWSERHAAFASGLGTFGLCDGLITPVGKAMRCGSLVARLSIPPTARPYNDPHEYCLFFSKGNCRKCMDRCPAGAITEEGHDKEKCRVYLNTISAPYVKERFGFATEACGLCQTKVPCESRIPLSRKDR
jgi:epoxyqueuosine reductase QueG